MKLLHVEKVFKSFGEVPDKRSLFLGVSVTFKQGKTYALQGVSGCGKSTFLHMIAGLDSPTTGLITFDQKNMCDYSSRERAAQVVLVTQTPLFIKELSVVENVALSALLVGRSKKSAYENAEWYLELVGLIDYKDFHIGKLSGGQKQRVALARALVVKPFFLCADEVTGSLDEVTGQHIIDLLLFLQKQEAMGLIISSHNPIVAAQMGLVFTIKDGILVPNYQSSNLEGVYDRSDAQEKHLAKAYSSR